VDSHPLLDRLAGQLPDDLMTGCRTNLGEAVAGAVVADDLPLMAAGLDLLRAPDSE
jgi:hypothetical protein